MNQRHDQSLSIFVQMSDFSVENCNANRIDINLYRKRPCISWFYRAHNSDQHLQLSIIPLHVQNGSGSHMGSNLSRCNFCKVRPCGQKDEDSPPSFETDHWSKSKQSHCDNFCCNVYVLDWGCSVEQQILEEQIDPFIYTFGTSKSWEP